MKSVQKVQLLLCKFKNALPCFAFLQKSIDDYMELESKKLTFQEWLLKRYGITPLQQKDLCRKTGRASDYHVVMEWYQRRYRLEQETREALIRANPFLSETLTKVDLFENMEE